MFELIFIGTSVGLLSGFFGIGGGTILVPLLLLLGYQTKDAIGIAIVQMVFSSIYGSYLNSKKGSLDIKMVINIALGGFVGALLSGTITSVFSSQVLELIFLSFATFALLKLFFKTQEHKGEKKVHGVALFIIGFLLGALSMTIGVGGSILLIPILVGYLRVPLKKAISAGLFFVVFSSISGLISHAIEGNIMYEDGMTVGLASLLGVYVGIALKDTVNATLQKNLLVVFYLCVVVYLAQRIFI